MAAVAVVTALVAAALGLVGPVAVAGAQAAPGDSTTTTSSPTTTTTRPPGSSTTTTTRPPGSSTTTTTSAPLTVPTLPGLPDPGPETGSTLPAGPVPTIDPRTAQLGDLQAQYEDATTDELDFLKRYLDAQSQAQELGGQVDSLNASLAQLDTQLAVAEADVRSADRHLADVRARLRDAQAQLTREQKRLRAQAVDAYIGGGTGTTPTDAVLRGQDANEAGTTVVYAGAVVDDTRTTIDRVTDLRDEVARLQVEAQQARDDAASARDRVAAQETSLRGRRDQQAQLQQAVEAQAKVQQDLLVESAQRRADYSARIAALARTSDGIAGTLAKRQQGEVLPLITAGMFLGPIPNPNITSTFGARVDPFLGTARMHTGIDMSAPTGTPIRASADGEVVIASDQGGYGLCTVIDHGSGLGTLYGHQSVLGVQVGDKVKRGQIIGYVGSTGRSTGPHVHWEVRQFGQPVDPLPYLGPG